MPDVHAGKGCTIGTTMTITDKAVPIRLTYLIPELLSMVDENKIASWVLLYFMHQSLCRPEI